MFFAENRMRRAGGGDHDVGAVDRVVELLERRSASPLNFWASADGAFVGAIADENLIRAVRQQVPRRQLAHLARADQVNALALQIAEDLLGQIDRDRRDRDRRRGDRGLGAHALGHGEGARAAAHPVADSTAPTARAVA